MSLHRDTRIWMESMVNMSVRDPENAYFSIQEILVALKVEPSRENALIFQLGAIYGGATRMERGKFPSVLIDRYNESEIISLLSDRADRLAKAFNPSKDDELG